MAGTQQTNGGRLADNIVHFARALRKAGLPVGPATVVDAIRAVEVAGIGERDDFYWTLHAVFVSKREHRPVFHEAFQLFWRERGLIEKMLQMLSPVAPPRPGEKEKPKPGRSRASEALASNRELEESIQPEIEVDARLTMSAREILQKKDFAQMSVAEIEAAKKALAALRLPDDLLETRRIRAATHGRLDPRRTLRASMRVGGDIIMPQFRSRARVRPPLVALCDISGSMSAYSRLFLHFLHALAEQRRRVHSFVFGTRLTNVTRQLQMKDPDEALAGCTEQVADWSGGTRIASALHSFNRDWARRVLGQGATVLLITDGLERDTEADLGHEMDRLHRSCRRLIWLNPLLRYEGFEARAGGIKAMLPHVDEFRAAHSLDAIGDLVEALSGKSGKADPRGFLSAA
ncbi:MAG TPA: VWA domain-containing protein [Afifellaceae bacterium]|nr:VWA domain-containing protein [Afifellaceae bacterium]